MTPAAGGGVGAVDHSPRSLRLLGPFEFRRNDEILILPHGVQRLVALLATNGPHSRTHAAEVLWPDADASHASANLRACLARLTTIDAPAIDVGGEVLALSDYVGVDLHRRLAWIDAAIYDRATSTAALGGAPPIRDGIGLLPGWDEWWLINLRDRLSVLQGQALESTAERLIAIGRVTEALPYALAAVHTQPWSESATRLVIEIHARRGDPSSALRRFRMFRRVLRDELGVSPGPDMRAVVRQLYPFGELAGPDD